MTVIRIDRIEHSLTDKELNKAVALWNGWKKSLNIEIKR